MKLLSTGLAVLLLALLASGCGSKPKYAAKHPVPPSLNPVVATSFTNLRPARGQHETVQIQFFEGKHRLAGGHLSVTISYAKNHVIHLKGSTTNKQGIATASFVVPRVVPGTILHATTTVLYKGSHYVGGNQVKVLR